MGRDAITASHSGGVMKKLLTAVGAFVIAGMGLFPPWQITIIGEKTIGPVPSGYHFVLRSRTQSSQGAITTYSIDLAQLAVQTSVVALMVCGAALIVPSERKRTG